MNQDRATHANPPLLRFAFPPEAREIEYLTHANAIVISGQAQMSAAKIKANWEHGTPITNRAMIGAFKKGVSASQAKQRRSSCPYDALATVHAGKYHGPTFERAFAKAWLAGFDSVRKR